MIFRFESFELDTSKFELRAHGEVRPVEPQVFGLLALLVENRERLVSRDEIIEKVWDGRAVSDAAVASRVKSARKALGDDGKAQRLIKTLHGQGFRFLGHVHIAGAAGSPVISEDGTATEPIPARVAVPAAQPSIAVLPFHFIGSAGPFAAIADALPHELIAELSRMHWLFVIARGSSFRLRATDADPAEIGRLLGVRYCLSGTLEITGSKLVVTVALADTRQGGVLWAERFSAPVDEVHRIRAEIRSRIVAALEVRIPLHEAEVARLAVTEHMDSWLSFHLGLQHVYRFNRSDNEAAEALFAQAIAFDPAFARAHAGLSFVHFQTAFLRNTDDVAAEVSLAREFAERAVELDSMDPFVNFTMGRTFWLEGDLDASLVWLERATSISPNYAHGIYARAWTESLAGRCLEGRRHADLAMSLSPLDPLHYAMLGTRAFTHMAGGEDAEASVWAERAARSPWAHVLIAMIAVAAHALAGDDAKAGFWADRVRARNRSLTQADFFHAFPMKTEQTRARISKGLTRFGF